MSGEFDPKKDGTPVDGVIGTYAWVDDAGKYMFGDGDSFVISYIDESFFYQPWP
ncbi:hypothetical protein [Thalassotalea sp. Y01]|uniref:hypothetical protein n=1 Tax=Thalassotalea sp. Y01 TaxID=2729613 RepID=UPI00145C7176|nr:hypothetical protein [Thalassotalea sp. Y01]NMP14827.1 hypothetical protein [Thalassotalea sp. Y01]